MERQKHMRPLNLVFLLKKAKATYRLGLKNTEVIAKNTTPNAS